jgi:hypothetical protein
MAFGSAAGWGNLPQGNFSPVIYSQKVLKTFRKASVVEDITNTDYAGEIANFGDTVKIIKEPTITVSDYKRGQTLVSQALNDDEITMTVDQAKYFQFEVDDIEMKHAHVNWESMSTDQAAYQLKDAYDVNVLTYMIANAGTSTADLGSNGSPIDLGTTAPEISPLTVMNRASRIMAVNNVPTDNQWFVAPPTFWEQLYDENSKIIGTDWESTGGNNSLLRNGRVGNGMLRGFRCYKSNNIPLSAGGHYQFLFGHQSSTATAQHIAKIESFRSQDSFADVVRGLHLFGRKVLRPEAVYAGVYSID